MLKPYGINRARMEASAEIMGIVNTAIAGVLGLTGKYLHSQLKALQDVNRDQDIRLGKLERKTDVIENRTANVELTIERELKEIAKKLDQILAHNSRFLPTLESMERSIHNK